MEAKAYHCEPCGYGTNTKYDYDRHCKQARHLEKLEDPEGNEKKTCKKCNKVFSSVRNLTAHKKRMHENSKPILFHCDICDADFEHQQAKDYHEQSVAHARKIKEWSKEQPNKDELIIESMIVNHDKITKKARELTKPKKIARDVKQSKGGRKTKPKEDTKKMELIEESEEEPEEETSEELSDDSDDDNEISPIMAKRIANMKIRIFVEKKGFRCLDDIDNIKQISPIHWEMNEILKQGADGNISRLIELIK